jgi:hypothetical protein
MAHQTRIMYVEHKGSGLVGTARIGWVMSSKSGRSVYYRGKRFQSLSGFGYKANYFNVETGEHYWISGCKKDGTDGLYTTSVEIDEDARETYWLEIRQRPDLVKLNAFKGAGKHVR